jgi:hypothetical protein
MVLFSEPSSNDYGTLGHDQIQHHRTALYLRVSTKGPKHGREQSPENQRKQLRAFAEAME